LPGSKARFVEPDSPGARWATRVLTSAEDYLSRHYPYAPWRWFAVGRILWRIVRQMLHRLHAKAVGEIDIFHSPAGGLPDWTRRRAGLRGFITIYDLIPIIHPSFFPPGASRKVHQALRGIDGRDWILCISESTRQDLLAHLPNANPARTLVIPLAAEDRFHPETDPTRMDAVRKRYGVPPDAPYFLSVSTLEPRKNFETVINAFARFVHEDRSRPCYLLLVGGKVLDGILASLQATYAEDSSMRERVIFTGFVPDEDLAALYCGSLAFIYLSYYEGFGLPILEAMQCGIPVIASNVSSIPEVAGEAGILLAPTDEAGVAASMKSLYHDPVRRREMADHALRRAAQFTWKQFEESTLEAYASAMREEA
jgi:glycosyltransferase involved in cell wall biosynthesis